MIALRTDKKLPGYGYSYTSYYSPFLNPCGTYYIIPLNYIVRWYRSLSWKIARRIYRYAIKRGWIERPNEGEVATIPWWGMFLIY